MDVRFGRIVATPVGINPYWDVKVTGADIQKHQAVLDKFGFKSTTPEETVQLSVSSEFSYGDGEPNKLKVRGKAPAAEDIEGLSNLIAEAEPNTQNYNPNGKFEQDKDNMLESLLNSAVALLKKQDGDIRQAIGQVAKLLKK